MTNNEIIEEELKKIHGEYVFIKAQAIINGKYNGGEDEWKNKFFKPRATILLAKLNRLDKKNVEEAINKNTVYVDGRQVLQGSDYNRLVDQILTLIPEEGKEERIRKLEKFVEEVRGVMGFGYETTEDKIKDLEIYLRELEK